MNVMLQRHCARYIYVVPEGLKELMSDISREVIRSNPENIHTFIADYLDALLITRENARVAARLVQSIIEIAATTVEFLLETGMDRPEADKVVTIIQKEFRKQIQAGGIEADSGDTAEEVEEKNVVSNIIHLAEIPPEIGEEAAIIIQRAYRRFKERRDKERELLSGMVDWRVAARSAIRLYRKTGVTYEEANRAATLIKAAYKGYYTRRIMRKLAEESKVFEERFEEEIEEEELYDHDQKNVTIDYQSVIPHVDFEEPKLTEEESSEETSLTLTTPDVTRKVSTVSTIVGSITQDILEYTFQEIDKKTNSQLRRSQEVSDIEEKKDRKSELTPSDIVNEITSGEETEGALEKIEEVEEIMLPQEIDEQGENQEDTEQEQIETGEQEMVEGQPAEAEEIHDKVEEIQQENPPE